MSALAGTFEGPARRIAVAGLAVIVMLGVAIGVTLWRYGVANSKYTDALKKSQTIGLVERATDKLVDVSTNVNVLAVSRATDQLANFQQVHGVFNGAMSESAQIAPNATKKALLGQISTAADALFAQAEHGVLPAAGTPRVGAQVRLYNARLTELETPLDALRDTAKSEAAHAQVAASGAASDARAIALITGLLAALGALLAAVYASRLVGRQFNQIDAQVDHIKHQVAHIDRIRATAGSLAEAATEMRAAAAESASATSQQSAGIAEAASTIEELDATAAVIADNARAGTTAVEQTGDTMRDMQEQVEAISQRSLSLGERSQKIGEVLELINGIAEQTNLLALNAAIEAARAGEAGQGFAVVASEVRKLAERSIRSTDSIREIITGVQDETNATIMATEQGAKQAREVGELMHSTAGVLDESIRATDQQKEAASQVAGAMVEIRAAAEQLAAEQQERAASAARVEELVEELEQRLAELSDLADARGASNGHANTSNGVAEPSSVVGSGPRLPTAAVSR
jgi:methyl-accepting chemotaxis protein